MTKEQKKRIAFNNIKLPAGVYWKPTLTKRYLNYDNPRIKSGIVKPLANQAGLVCNGNVYEEL